MRAARVLLVALVLAAGLVGTAPARRACAAPGHQDSSWASSVRCLHRPVATPTPRLVRRAQ